MTKDKVLEHMGFIKETSKDGQWSRFRHINAPDGKTFALIVYDDSSEEEILQLASDMLIKVGKYQKIEEFQNLMSL